MSAEEPQTNLEMWSRGLDEMILAPTEVGCTDFRKVPLIDRVAHNANALSAAGFTTKELQAVLAIALDRLAGLALEGATVYGSYDNDE